MKPCKITVDLYNTFRERMPEYVQYDRNVPLEITVLENGKPADLNGLFGRLLVSKPDGHEVYSNDVEINGNVITTILGEQVFTASGVAQVTVDILDEQDSKRALIPFGMRIRSAIITDESIKSSNDYQTITALISDVRALDAMFHVEQEQRAEAFEQSEADREQRFETQMTEWAQTFEQAEATRQFNEGRRQSAESKRESAEEARESAERQRVDTEAVRQRQEQERGQGEAGRATAEANRVKAEQTRVDNESSRKSAESSRVNAESQRATAESHRVTAETSRVNAESQRATAETNRAGAEGRRSEAESNRVTAENNRTTAESKRVTAENTRETQENARREAEEDRATRMTQWEAKAEETAQKAQKAVDSAQAFVNVNEAKLLGPNDKKDYMGNSHESVKEAMDSNVDWLLGEINTVHYEGQHITTTDTIEGRSKSAILKGQTLVNLVPEKIIDYTASSDWDGYHQLVQNSKQSFDEWRALQDLKPNTKYYISCHVETFEVVNNEGYRLNNPSVESIFEDSMIVNGVGRYQWVSTTKSELTDEIFIVLRSQNANARGAIKIRDIMIIEYQEGMENWDIPYFEGMQSVEMPVLTTSNFLKVLGNEEIVNIYNSMGYSNVHAELSENGKFILTGNGGWYSPNKVWRLEPNTTYIARIQGEVSFNAFYPNAISNVHRGSFDGGIYVKFTTDDTGDFGFLLTFTTGVEVDFNIFYGDVTSKLTEPYKSNILTVNEDITLRGIGDVQDTLDCLTGEVVERIGEIVFDGNANEQWKIDGWWANKIDTIGFEIESPAFLSDRIICETVTVSNYSGLISKDERAIAYSVEYGVVMLRLLRTELATQDLNGLKQWLSQNPIVIQYQLATPTVKTVDLSDNHVYSYKDVTHYDCSSAEGSLVPTLSIDVPTNLPAVVARQRATIRELEKENQELAHAVTIVDEHREEGDLELLSSDFDFELRLMEIEFAIGIPMMANYKGVRNMARTPYDMAKALILGGKYEREEMTIKLDRFEKLGSITADQKAELIALMDAVELTQ